MIKAGNETLEIKGKKIEVLTDLEVIIRYFRKNYPEDLKVVLQISKLSDKEVAEKIDGINEILKTIMDI